MLTRRFYLATLPLLSACAVQNNPNQPNTVTVTVDLANAQKQAQAMAEMANDLAGQISATMPDGAQQNLRVALQAMNAAVSAFVGLPPDQSPSAAQYASAASKAIMAVLPLLPIPSVAKIAVMAGLALVEAFAAGMSQITVPAPNPPAAPRGGHQRIYRAPVPIFIP
jgi:hypothetical protein